MGGLMAGFAALLLTGRMNAGHPIASIGMEFDAVAAVVVGGTSFERGNGWLPGTLLGVLTDRRAEERPQRAGRPFVAAGGEHRAAGDRRAARRLDPRPRRERGSARPRISAGVGAWLPLSRPACSPRISATPFLTVEQPAERAAPGQPDIPDRIGRHAGDYGRRPDLSIGANVGLSACIAAAVIKATGIDRRWASPLGLPAGRRSVS